MIVMSIAGVDPSGGAGIFADIKTFQAIGVYGTGIVASLTAQNPNKVFSLKPIETSYISEQIDAVMDSYDIEYVKTGMLYSTDIIKLVSQKIKQYDLKAIVDPVMVATSGSVLSKTDFADNLKKYLLKHALFTTPNTSEAQKLTGLEIANKEDAIEASLKLGEVCNNVITGGHLNGINVINIDGEITIKNQKLIESENVHGTGCNFSSAITAYLASGFDLKTSTLKASEYVYKAVENGKYGTPIAPL